MDKTTIWRVPLNGLMNQQIQLPPDSRVISAQVREGSEEPDQIDLWAEVRPTVPKKVMFYNIVLVCTGENVPDLEIFRYISTLQLKGGRDIYHVYAQAVQPGELRLRHWR